MPFGVAVSASASFSCEAVEDGLCNSHEKFTEKSHNKRWYDTNTLLMLSRFFQHHNIHTA